MAERQAHWPHALSATSTHDTKRGEDVRARLAVLSEMPRPWKEAVSRWRALNRRFKKDPKGLAAPDPNEEYFIYQTLVGAWPFESDEETRSRFVERIVGYMTKALREAKVHTSWLNPDEDYEQAVGDFVRAILDPGRAKPFLQAFEPFQKRVAQLGIYNSLSQLLIKITAPGVPDFYQGTEFWDLNLVDPDNRRQVDYRRRREILSGLHPCSGREASPEALADLLDRRSDGHVKMYAMNRALSARAALRDAFDGDYTPLATSGAARDCVFAFARGGRAITCVPRLVAALTPDGAPPLGPAVWTDTRVELPEPLRGRRYRNVFTGAVLDGGDGLAAATVLERFPVALLVPAGDPSDRDDRP
jgi:(1->4)-alpha-D-glucan 1-alpha-D-glucosylmutase